MHFSNIWTLSQDQGSSGVLDAGYNPGKVGDVDYAGAVDRPRLITPVPGGVGPMTIAVLLEQTLPAATSAH